MMSDEQELVSDFLNGLARQQVIAFIKAVAEEDEMIIALGQVDLAPEQVAAFARARGYAFDADDLVRVIESRIASLIPEAEREVRDQYLKRRADGACSAPVVMDAETDANLVEVAHERGFKLDRRSILRGDVVAVRQLPALPGLLALMEESLTGAFDGTDLEQIHLHHDFPDMKARAAIAYDSLTQDKRIIDAVQTIIVGLGLDPDSVLWEWPGMRLLFPAEHGGRGVYRTANSGALAAHRDTWYGSPQHQINLWGPIRQLDPDATLRIYTRYFRKTVANSSRGYDTWQNRCGLALPPSIQTSVSAEGAFAPPLEIGDVMCFSGHQLHASAVNRSGRTRVSFEFRLLHKHDEGQDYAAPNTDYQGIGEIYGGWFDAQGRCLNRLTGEVSQV